MKKTIVLMLFLSVLSFGSRSFEVIEDILEARFDFEYSIISDSRYDVRGLDYDLTISYGSAYMEIEIDSMFGGSTWKKLSPSVIEEFISTLVDIIRKEVNNPDLRVIVYVKSDRELGNDQILFNKTY
ncbi:hypothetical protein PM10SUCC1_28960 [Propionigenium maris DSM 9537]|uniref:Uncharacterized protein n=1 Tax=Propionigenium maris DSM 9537 TaxID=1123000 RepID=A0A9W6GN35_9FUSO|nr:hypothetical protein [Propionigenium maris]GLI57382.1 hypothetical protein PM10SUCC1_28960 [Propionigenium maris DSM 9537]